MTDLMTTRPSGSDDLIEQVVIQGNLSNLTAPQRAAYYAKVCSSLGLNPYSRPFEYLMLQQNKLTLYARKDATDQLRSLRRVSLSIVSREVVNDVYVVTARATLPDGRTDEEIGAVPIGGLKGEAYANALMKASTKAKRRVTLSVCGLGWLDESEVESIPGARVEEPDPGPNLPRMAAVRELMDAAVAEADAGITPHEQEQPPAGPRWATTAAGRQISALADALTDAGKKFSLPPDDADEQQLAGWIASKRGLLGQRGS